MFLLAAQFFCLGFLTNVFSHLFHSIFCNSFTLLSLKCFRENNVVFTENYAKRQPSWTHLTPVARKRRPRACQPIPNMSTFWPHLPILCPHKFTESPSLLCGWRKSLWCWYLRCIKPMWLCCFPPFSPPLVFCNFNVIHCIEGLEMSGRLFYPPELWLNLSRSCFLFPCLMIYFFLYLTHTDPHTYIPTIGTEQYRGDLWGFLRRAACEGSQQAFTQTIYSRRLSVRWIYSKASRRLAWESSVLSSEPQILQRTAGAAAGRTLTWEVSMTTDSPKERLLFGRGGLNATTIENETLKKRRVTLWHNRVLFLVPRPLERWFSHL